VIWGFEIRVDPWLIFLFRSRLGKFFHSLVDA
jgi:hypothetical protein